MTVSARYQPEGRWVVVGVADGGIGIASQDQVRLFTPFHRIRCPETETVVGTRLGLSIAGGLVELMEGTVWVESELGRGSSFFFSLPTVWPS